MSKNIASGLFIVNKKCELLIAHPTNHRADFWSIPKGLVEKDELLIDCAVRETYEEVNVDLSKYKSLFIKLESQNYNKKKKILSPFLIFEETTDLDFSKFELKCNSIVPERGFYEMDDFRWVSLHEASKLLHETQVKLLEKIKIY